MRLAALWAAAALSACAAAPVLDVPIVVQQKNGCGAAAIAMVMGYWHERMPEVPAGDSEGAIFDRLYVPGEKGIRGADMARYLEQRAFRVFLIRADEADLSHHVARGRPLIVCLRPGKSAPNHYVVVVGADPGSGTVSFVDPARGMVICQRTARFRREWEPAGNWALLAVPRTSE
ncbi:MAG: C39 family peptidase [Acidobacteriota bacterium]